MSRPPLPPFTRETAAQKARMAEDAWNSRDPERVSLSYNGTAVLVNGAPQNVEPDVAGAVCTIELELGLGRGRATYLTSDLSYDYVRINAEYRS